VNTEGIRGLRATGGNGDETTREVHCWVDLTLSLQAEIVMQVLHSDHLNDISKDASKVN